MTLTDRSKKAGHADGSFSYGDFIVQPHVADSNRAGVTVNDEHHFSSWRAAKEWIDSFAEYEETPR